MSELSRILREEFRDGAYAHGYVEEFLSAYIATQISVLRKQRGLTQSQLGEIAGMTQDRISRLEDDSYANYSLATLKKLAKAFDLSLKVSFECFSTALDEIDSFSPHSLERASRADEYAHSNNNLSGVWELHGKKVRKLAAMISGGSDDQHGVGNFATSGNG
jgi:transcriptional regulator with XRE-family HTH domain